jgi:hypothetical protein
MSATVFVPQEAGRYFLEKVEQYRSQETPQGRPKNQGLVARIETARLANTRSLFTDDAATYPERGHRVWWEVWLRAGAIESFRAVSERLHVPTKPHYVRFPEREVVLALLDEDTLEHLIENSDLVMELRVAKDSPAVFIDLRADEQHDWAGDLLARLDGPSDCSIVVCILDGGVTREHPLIAPALAERDLHAYSEDWGTADDGPLAWRGHGTAMAGIALYGDLVRPLSSSDPVSIRHCLESVKILPPGGSPPNDPELFGAITREAVARATIEAPDRHRLVCMAVSSIAASTGRPSSWSSELDQLCFDDGRGMLFAVAAGNIDALPCRADYPSRNDLEGIKDPGQAWNALTVGAFTEKVNLSDANYEGWAPLAPAGEIAPASCTSIPWERRWPAKPDIVMEGGNLAACGETQTDTSAAEELQLLTTFYEPARRLFTTFGDTSAATAQASRLAAQIMVEHPQLWPESVRALVVHSAEWTTAMLARFQNELNGGTTRQNALHALLRRYGFGVPDLEARPRRGC